jgi:peptidoglycan/xylan/chitin deacetylase (PgdA/CDA1 family)
VSQALILMYHRVTHAGPDPWGLRVTPDHLAEHLEVLQRRFCPIPLKALVSALRNGIIPPRSIVVTFDDGYADNLHTARPLLERYQIPATVFLVTGSVESGDPFWWDVLEQILLHPGTLPPRLSLRIAGNSHQWDLGDAWHYPEERGLLHHGWRAGENAPTARHSLYLSVWELLRRLAQSQRRETLEQLVDWAGTAFAGRADYRLLSPPEVLDLARSNQVEIGAHSVTHPMLDALPLELQRSEIEQSKASLEELLGEPVTSFAYPHGAHTLETAALVRTAGYACACSTLAAAVSADADPHRLPRMHIGDWDGEGFAGRLAHWFGS